MEGLDYHEFQRNWSQKDSDFIEENLISWSQTYKIVFL